MSETNQTATELHEGSILNSRPLIEEITPLLFGAAKEALTRKATSMIMTEDGTTYRAFPMQYRVNADQVQLAIDNLARDLNIIADAGFIKSVVAPPTAIDLARNAGQKDQVLVLCYPLVPTHKEEYVSKVVGYPLDSYAMNIVTPDDTIDLPPGDFYAAIRLSYKLQPSDDRVERAIGEYLKLLPDGTTVVSIRACSITDLSEPYEVIFRNPIMRDVREIKVEYVRMAAAVDDKLVQFALPTQIKYMKRDGTVIP